MKPTRLAKQQSRERWAQLRLLWREFDPIGVYEIDANWPSDEYDRYVNDTMRLLEKGSNQGEFVDYLKWACEQYMGLSPVPEAHYAEFATRLRAWYDENWSGTIS